MDKITVGIVTVSDRCYRKEAMDESGPNLVAMIKNGIIRNGEVVRTNLVPDDRVLIEELLKTWRDEMDVILTTGGTGISERDVTPEATIAVSKKLIPGIQQLIFKKSSEITALAALSRGVACVSGKSLIINLPGSKKAAQECLEAIAEVIPHAVDLISEKKVKVEQVHAALKTKKSCFVPDSVADRKRMSPYCCLHVTEAQNIILDCVNLLKKKKVVKYKDAHGYVLAEDFVAKEDFPAFDVSVFDGYAVASSNKCSVKEVVLIQKTADPLRNLSVDESCCARISTGAILPVGTDAVVPVENTEVKKVSEDQKEEKMIVFNKLPKKGEGVRLKGSDHKLGELILPSGTYLDSSAVGVLAAMGVTSVNVFDKPLVAVMSTGDELSDPEVSLKPGKVRDSNRITLINLLKEEGFKAVDLGIAIDETESLRDSLERGFRVADVVITTGSMSMGERDYLKEIIVADFNGEISFGRVYMKPGKPTSFAVVMFEGKPKLWFGLPGNPASAYVTSHLFLLPALRKISNQQKIFPCTVKATVKEVIPREDRPHYVRGVLTYTEDNKWYAEVTGNQMSSRIGSCVNANCLVLIPPKTVGTDKPTNSDSISNEFETYIIGKINCQMTPLKN